MTIRDNVRFELVRGAMTLLIFSGMTIVGCGKSDMSGYRTVKQNDAPPATTSNDSTSTSKQNLPGTASNTLVTSDSNNEQTASVESNITAGSEEAFLPVSALLPVNVLDGASMQALLKAFPRDATSTAGQATITKVSAAAGTSDSNPPADATKTDLAEPRKVEVLIPEKTFRQDVKSKALRISYDDLDLLKVLNMEPVTVNAVNLMPEWLKGLNGQRIKIRGFMFPTFDSEGLEQFVLARDNQICCFGRDPKVYDLVEVSMKTGKTTNYIPATRSFDVVGRLRIQMVESEGKPFGLYFLDDAEVIDR